ncbi:hypothetical protein QSJ19_26010, partial [Gordonia sp. ABSL11-1]|nr:hypothetical protein [Gordonia sp. ABSL11-1]
MYGWWQSFEHFSFPDSSPIATSADLPRIERHVRENWQVKTKKPVIGSFEDGAWTLEYRVDASKLHRQSVSQRLKYDRARRSGSRGNLGPVPPKSELLIRSIDLDADSNRDAGTNRPRQEASDRDYARTSTLNLDP